MSVIEIDTLDYPGVEVFSSMTEAQLRRADCAGGIFIAESPKVIDVALGAGYTPVSMLCERRHIEGDAAEVIGKCGDIPVFTGSRELLSRLTGYTLTRGVLCAMRRKEMTSVGDVCAGAKRIAVVDEVSDTTNIGAIFRSAAALGVDAVVLTRRSCDPLNRRSIRVSMGSVFLVPWTWLDTGVESLREYGFKTAAMALSDNSVSIDDERVCMEPRLAIVLGSEGYGLDKDVIDSCDYVVKIPMAHGVDSLNVAAASAVAFWQLRVR